MSTVFHVFTSHNDEWFDNHDEAKALYNKWAKDNGEARMYEEVWPDDPDVLEETDEPLKSECLYTFGDYPS